jgi:DNA-binding MarR family transcriptional regulator
VPNTDDFIGVVISDVARLLRTAFDRRVHALGLTRAQWLVLTRVHRRPGASQSELADMMEVEKASAGRMLDRLEAKGWVKRRAQDGDRRVWRIYLTSEAERVHKRMWRIAEATVGDALADLSARESAQLMTLLKRVKGTLAALDGATRNGANGAGRVVPRAHRATTHRADGSLAP